MTEKGATVTTEASQLTLARYTVLNALQMSLIECEADASVRSIARAMADNTVHCVVVRGIEREDRSGNRIRWGIVSDLDLMAGLRPGFNQATAGELAASEVIVMNPSDTLEHAAQLMAEHETGHAVVVDAGEPVGIISTLDVARFAAG
jgi:CBS domain-containing protein